MEILRLFFKILNHSLNKKHKVNTIGRILWWKANQLFFHLPVVVTIDKSGMICVCDPKRSYGGLMIYLNLPEYQEMTFFKKILTDKSTFIDVGANIGIYSLLAASIIKKGKIYSFEPSSSVLGDLYQNIRINDLEDRVQILEKVASDKTGYREFVMEDISEYSHIACNKTSNSLSVQSIKLDDFCGNKKISFVDVIKIDVEGAEFQVLKGLETYLKRGKVGILIIELNRSNQSFGTDSNEIIDYLKKLNYHAFKFNEENGLERIDQIDKDQTINVIVKRVKNNKLFN